MADFDPEAQNPADYPALPGGRNQTPSGSRNPNTPPPSGGVPFNPDSSQIMLQNPAGTNFLLPQTNPFNPKTGLPGAWLNNIRPPSTAMQPTVDVLSGQLLNPHALNPGARSIPGADLLAMQDASRQMQLGAAAGVRNAGGDMRAQQAMLPGQITANAMPSTGVQNQLLASGAGLGMGNAQGQNWLAALLSNQAAGVGGPTAAGAMFQGNLDRNIAAQRALSSGVRGQSAAGASRQGTQAGVELGLRAQADAAALRAQEQQAAQQALGNVLGTARTQDINTFATRGDQASQAGQDALARSELISSILQGTRGQDIGQAVANADVLSGLRGQDIDAAQVGGNLELGGRELDDRRRQAAIMNALGLGELQLQGGIANNQGFLGAAGVMGDWITGRRMADTARMGENRQQTADEWGMFQDVLGSFGQVTGLNSFGGGGGGGGG